MEIHFFRTTDIEQKLYAIENALSVLNYAIQGLQEDYTGTDLDSSDTVILDAWARVQEIYRSMQPISLDWKEEHFAVIIGEEETAEP